jgi:proteasome alpha subunit
VIPVKDLEVAVLDRTRAQPRKFARIGPYRLEALLGERGPSSPAPDADMAPEAEPDAHAPGAASSDGSPDDPTDPTDQVSGDVASLEDPVAPPVAPPPAEGGPGPGNGGTS